MSVSSSTSSSTSLTRIWAVVTITTPSPPPSSSSSSLELPQCPIVSSVSEARWFQKQFLPHKREARPAELHNRCNLHKLYQMTGALGPAYHLGDCLTCIYAYISADKSTKTLVVAAAAVVVSSGGLSLSLFAIGRFFLVPPF